MDKKEFYIDENKKAQGWYDYRNESIPDSIRAQAFNAISCDACGNFVNGKMEGMWTALVDHPRVKGMTYLSKIQVEFVNGKKDGIESSYGEYTTKSGKTEERLLRRTCWKNGKRHGDFHSYKDGVISCHAVYHRGLIVDHETFDHNGALMSRSKTFNDCLTICQSFCVEKGGWITEISPYLKGRKFKKPFRLNPYTSIIDANQYAMSSHLKKMELAIQKAKSFYNQIDLGKSDPMAIKNTKSK